MRKLIILVLAVTHIGCGITDPYTIEKADFIAYNYTGDDVVAFIDSKDIGLKEQPMLPNLPTKFTLEIKVPKPADTSYNINAPSRTDRDVNISVNFKVIRTGQTTSALSCKAGAKLTTRLFFRYVGNQIQTSCDNP